MSSGPVRLGPIGQRVATNIRIVRKHRGLDVADVVRILDRQGYLRLSADQVVRIEAGQRRCTVDELIALSLALDIHAGTLLGSMVLAVQSRGRSQGRRSA